MTGPTPVALYGTDEPVPEAAVFTVGSVEVEVVDGQLRAVRHAGREVLRAVAYVVRDADWGTLSVRREAETVERSPDRIRIAYRARCTDPSGAVLAFDAEITVRTDGVAFEVTARPEADFTTNRCGFCVLHPVVGVAGTPVEVEHTDGSVERSVFPGLIEPWQPFMDIRAITHTVAPGVTATCRMEGDVFEMEDQRNWSDASYKTYVRPLALPWPYALPAGRPFRQRVAVTVRDDQRRAVPTPTPATSVVSIELAGPAGTLPRIGLAVTPEETTAVLARAERLAAVGPQTLLLHFDPTAGHGAAALAGFAGLARRFAGETVLECVVPGRSEPAAELAEIAAAVGKADLRLDAVAVSPAADRQSTPPGSAWPPCPPLEEVYRAARAAFPGLRLGGGMFSYFTELNRKRPPVELLDFVTHCTCPIVHAADDLSVMQSLEALPFIVRSARAIVGDRPYRIGPSTIGMRQNPYGSRTFANPAHRRIPMATEDPRQRGLFAAAWLVGYAAATAEGGLEALTVGALTGAFGLIDEDGTGAVRPLFHAVRGLAALAGCPRLSAQSSHPGRVLAVAADSAGGTVIWLANVTNRPQTVQLGGYPTPSVDEIAVLDEHCFVFPPGIFTDMRPTVPNEDGVLILNAYAVARARVRR